MREELNDENEGDSRRRFQDLRAARRSCGERSQAGRKDAVPGVVASIQTFGSYLNFHPHVHALATEGVVAPDGTFVPVPAPDLGAVCELYRRLVLAGLRQANRLSEEFHARLLAWSPSGFSVFGEQVARADEPERLERLARYVTRAPFALDRVLVDGDAVGGSGGGSGGGGASEGRDEGRDEGRRRAGEPTLVVDDADGAADCGIDEEVAGHGHGRGGGRTAGSGGRGATGPHRRDPAPDVPRVRVLTPPDPATGRTVLKLDALEFVHRVTTQIPDPRRHLVRYYGAYASRTRGARRARRARQAEAAAAAAGVAAAESGAPGQPTAPAPPASPSRANWARLLRRIFEVDPLLCPRCGGGLAIVAVLTDPKVVDRILRHLSARGPPTSVHARDPPSDAADPSAA